jgi:hypothetical protein
MYYIARMKTSTLPAVRVEPALRSDAEAVLDDGESLSDFVAACVRDGVTWRRTQDAFLARAREAVERSERENNGISPQEVLRRMDDRLDAARKRLAAGNRFHCTCKEGRAQRQRPVVEIVGRVVHLAAAAAPPLPMFR